MVQTVVQRYIQHFIYLQFYALQLFIIYNFINKFVPTLLQLILISIIKHIQIKMIVTVFTTNIVPKISYNNNAYQNTSIYTFVVQDRIVIK